MSFNLCSDLLSEIEDYSDSKIIRILNKETYSKLSNYTKDDVKCVKCNLFRIFYDYRINGFNNFEKFKSTNIREVQKCIHCSEYSNCEECGKHNILCEEYACADDCCTKYVCYDSCDFKCVKCEKNYVSNKDIYIYPQDNKQNDNCVKPKVIFNKQFICKNCIDNNNTYQKAEIWFGLSMEEYIRRYG